MDKNLLKEILEAMTAFVSEVNTTSEMETGVTMESYEPLRVIMETAIEVLEGDEG